MKSEAKSEAEGEGDQTEASMSRQLSSTNLDSSQTRSPPSSSPSSSVHPKQQQHHQKGADVPQLIKKTPEGQDTIVLPARPAVPDTPLSSNSTAATPAFNLQDISEPAVADWDDVTGPSAAWTPSHSPEQTFGFAGLNNTISSSIEPLAIPQFDGLLDQKASGDAYFGGMHLMPPGDEWAGQLNTPNDSFSSQNPSIKAETADITTSTQNPMAYMQSLQDSLARRGSSDELAASLENEGIGAASQYTLPPQGMESGGPSASWKMPTGGKKLDLAARRKKPRPAAIGTGAVGNPRSGPPSARSPTARIPSFGPGQGMRHSKSAQSLNSRYGGVRKPSLTPRSPFALQPSGKAEVPRRLRSSASTSTLMPSSARLSPEDLSLLPSPSTMAAAAAAAMAKHPSTAAEGPGPSVSGASRMTDEFYSKKPRMHLSLASPPSTPMTPMYGGLPFAGSMIPMSAPPHLTDFPDFDSMTGFNNWPGMYSDDATPASIQPGEFEGAIEGNGGTSPGFNIPPEMWA